MDLSDRCTVEGEGKHETILMVGLLCCDLIFTAPHYPLEDTILRASSHHKRRGGNASNSCTVLSQLGAKCELLATTTTDEFAVFMKNDLKDNGVIFHHCPVYPEYDSAIAIIVLSVASGTRTILTYKSETYPENTVQAFNKLDLSDYKWIHFEGRGISETLKMIDVLDDWNAQEGNKLVPYSVELEKGAEITKKLIPKGDYVFVSKDFATFLGFDSPLSAINGLESQIKPGAVIIVPWGEQGAVARCSNGEIVKSEAYPPLTVVDTTGAGDTFIAATVFCLSHKKSVLESIDFGNKIAGAKCGMMGFTQINQVYNKLFLKKII